MLSTTRLEQVEATVLTGGTTQGVTTWLRQHGYAQKPAVNPLIGGHLRQGWSFTAVKLRRDRPEQAVEGEIDPVSLTFDSEELVYPMRMSSVSEESAEIEVFVLGTQFVRRGDPGADVEGQSTDLVAAVELPGGPGDVSGGDELARIVEGTSPGAEDDLTRLTRFEIDVWEPESLTSDFNFVVDSQQQEYRPTYSVDRTVTILGLPAGWLIGFLIWCGLLVAGGLALSTYRQRHRSGTHLV